MVYRTPPGCPPGSAEWPKGFIWGAQLGGGGVDAVEKVELRGGQDKESSLTCLGQ